MVYRCRQYNKLQRQCREAVQKDRKPVWGVARSGPHRQLRAASWPWVCPWEQTHLQELLKQGKARPRAQLPLPTRVQPAKAVEVAVVVMAAAAAGMW